MKIKIEDGEEYIFDIVRKKYVRKQPEEWVRQNIIQFLNIEKGYPISLMSIEKKNVINNIKKRCDIICSDQNGNPLLLVECKSMTIKLNTDAFNQSIIYNKRVKAKYILITNGIKHHCFAIINGDIILKKTIPSYQECINE
tara:strand:+ start:274 stop:696 length:423 start_codon:yes stop_codon:yes gene_type:complete